MLINGPKQARAPYTVSCDIAVIAPVPPPVGRILTGGRDFARLIIEDN